MYLWPSWAGPICNNSEGLWCGGERRVLSRRFLGDGQVCLVVEGGVNADLHRSAGQEQQRKLLHHPKGVSNCCRSPSSYLWQGKRNFPARRTSRSPNDSV